MPFDTWRRKTYDALEAWVVWAARRVAPSLSWAGAVAILSTFSAPLSAQAVPGLPIARRNKVVVGVYDDPKLLPQTITITPDGKISYPLVGELQVGGKNRRASPPRNGNQAEEIHL